VSAKHFISPTRCLWATCWRIISLPL